MSLKITGLSKHQINEVVAARRSLPIASVIRAGSIARDKLLAVKEGRRLTVGATNEATANCRESDVTAAPAIITFQVCSEEYVMAEAVKADLEEVDYDVLTYAFRSVLDPGGIPESLTSKLHRPLREPAPQPQTAQEPAGKAQGATTRRARKQPAKGKPAPEPKGDAANLQAWLDE